MKGRLVVVVLLDVLVWSLVVWLVAAPPDVPLERLAWHQAAAICRAGARVLGMAALEAERRYWEGVRA